MNKISFPCPYCGKKLTASDNSAGREKTCPNCRGRVVVPTPEVAAQKSASGPPKRRQVADHPILLMGRRPEHKDLIDMTAMVDIVFFLLIFFLVTSMQPLQAVINLPNPQAQASGKVQAVNDISADATVCIVTVDADDAIYVEDDEVLSEQDLRSRLRKEHDENGKVSLMINSNVKSSHGKFVMVIDTGAGAGMTKIEFSVPHTDDTGKGG